jgi:hypothetical protein
MTQLEIKSERKEIFIMKLTATALVISMSMLNHKFTIDQSFPFVVFERGGSVFSSFAHMLGSLFAGVSASLHIYFFYLESVLFGSSESGKQNLFGSFRRSFGLFVSFIIISFFFVRFPFFVLFLVLGFELHHASEGLFF